MDQSFKVDHKEDSIKRTSDVNVRNCCLVYISNLKPINKFQIIFER